jgi:hypothetical protein
MYNYFKYSILSLVLMPATALLVLFAPTWGFLTGVVITIFNLIVDNLTPPDLSSQKYRFPIVLDVFVYLFFPVALFNLFALLWLVAPQDLFHFGAWVHTEFGVDIQTQKSASGWLQWISCAFGVGYAMSAATVVGHELVHRTHDKMAMAIGRWLLALVGDAQFSISHVYSHHLHVGTDIDAATARRGESLYSFFGRSSIGQYREAWELEISRLERLKKARYFLSNRVITGLLMTIAVCVVFAAFAGWTGLAVYSLLVLYSKFLFEAVNYIEHYGLVRVPGTKVMPRHSWDCDSRASSAFLMNLTRHSHHHADAKKRYWELEVQEGGLRLNYGYIGHIMLAMIPQLWYRFAATKLREWDIHYASPDERELALHANRVSGNSHFLSGSLKETSFAGAQLK